MTATKVLSIILGVLVVIAGIVCICHPVGSADVLLCVILSIAMIVEGIGSISSWNTKKKAGVSDTWTLVGGIISIICGVAVILIPFCMVTLMWIIVFFAAFWLIIVGIMRIVASIKIKDFNKNHNIEKSPVSWVAMLILGILMVICGIIGLFNPATLGIVLGIFVGIGVITAGFALIAAGASA